MDYGVLPPEVNSGRMYTGSGAGPMLAAAVAWDELSTELHSTAAAYAAEIDSLVAGSWQGPTASAMAAAVGPYVSWISATAAGADHAAAQAKAAAAAYETAFAATVPPPVIAANRAQLLLLIATNIFGQNTPAIAATEAQYLEMWAQDAVAMYGYAGSSATATQLTPFTEPPQTTAASAAVTAPPSGQLSALLTSVPNALQGLLTTEAASPTTGSASFFSGIAGPQVASAALPPALAADVANWNTVLGVLTGPFSFQGWSSIPGGPFLSFGQIYAYAQNGQGLQSFLTPVQPTSGALTPIVESLTPHAAPAGSLGGAPSATLGRATLIGGMSVPQSWTMAAPAIRTVAASLATNLAAAPAVASGGEAAVFGQMALSSLAGRALAATTAGPGGGAAAVAGSLGGVIADADPAAAMIFVLPPLED